LARAKEISATQNSNTTFSNQVGADRRYDFVRPKACAGRNCHGEEMQSSVSEQRRQLKSRFQRASLESTRTYGCESAERIRLRDLQMATRRSGNALVAKSH